MSIYDIIAGGRPGITGAVDSFVRAQSGFNQLQGQRIQNKMREEALKNNPQMQDLQTQLLQAKVRAANAPAGAVSPMGKAINDLQRIISIYGPKSNEAQKMGNYVQKLQMMNQGLNISGGPTGGFSITQGGFQPLPSGQQGMQQPGQQGIQQPGQPGMQPMAGGQQIGQQSDQQPGQQSDQQPGQQSAQQIGPQSAQQPGQQGIIRSPMSSGGRYSGGGNVYYDPQTEQFAMAPTQALSTQIGKTALAAKMIAPEMVSFFKKVGPMLGTSNLKKRASGYLDNLRGKENIDYDKYTAAIVGDLPMMTESGISAMGFKPTVEAIKDIRKAMAPLPRDTKFSYARRVASSAANIWERQHDSGETATRGINFGKLKPFEKSKIRDKYEEQVYRGLLDTIGAKSGAQKQSAAAPKFKSAAEEVTWFKGLPREEQVKYLKKRGF